MKKYTVDAEKCLQVAETLALYTGNIVESVHILLAIVKNKFSYGGEISNRLGVNENVVSAYLIRTSMVPKEEKVIISPVVLSILDYAKKLVEQTDFLIDTHHILLAISFHKNCMASKILKKYGIDFENLSQIIEGMTEKKIGISNSSMEECGIKEDTNNNLSDNPLIKYGTDLTKKALKKELSPILEREKEIERLIRIIARKNKNNPILVGESGVGKTAIVYGLAQRIANGNVPELLKNKKIIELHTTSIVAGTRYRGDMEEKIDEIFREAIKNNCCLFIDELHSILSAGAGENGLSLGNLLKPMMDEQNLVMIGTTTFSEYSKFIEKDPAFERRFMKVVISEPSEEQCYCMLKGLSEGLEKHYSLTIPEQTIRSSIRLSVRYLPNRFLPDKALDILDEACSKVCIAGQKEQVKSDDIKDIIHESTGIPIQDIQEENEKLLSLNSELKQRIIGQEEALNAISSSIIRSKSGLHEGKRPIGSFLFLGTTGVGKTETAKALSEILFGTEQALIRFDMSEYMDKNSSTRLIGAPPGYVGYDEGGILTENVKNKPYSVILFDEIEKAHTDIFNILLQVLDDGRLTDGKGRTVDFSNTVIIMTSNIGTDSLEKKNNVGFGETKNDKNEHEIQLKALKETFRPEFINRIDNIIVFHRLHKEHLLIISNNILERKKKILYDEKGILLHFAPNVAEYFADRAYDETYGARPLKRTIESLLENELSEMIISRNLKNTELFISVCDGEILISE